MLEHPKSFSASIESQKRLDIAKRFVGRIVHENTLCIALTGSVSIGLATKESDIDLVVFLSDSDSVYTEEFWVEGVQLSIAYVYEHYPDVGNSTNDPTKLWALREINKLLNSIILYEKGDFSIQMKSDLGRYRLSRQFVSSSISKSHSTLEESHKLVSMNPLAALLGLRASFMLFLVPVFHSPLTPINRYYSKPKWEMRTIKSVRIKNTYELYSKLFYLSSDMQSIQKRINGLEYLENILNRCETENPLFFRRRKWFDELLNDARTLFKDDNYLFANAPIQYALYEFLSLICIELNKEYTSASEGLVEITLSDIYNDALDNIIKVIVGIEVLEFEKLYDFHNEIRQYQLDNTSKIMSFYG